MTSNSTRRPLPGQRPLPRAFLSHHQRLRLIAALAQEASERGYLAVTVADVVKRAGTSRKTFYENFHSKDDCFLAAQEHVMATALERVVEAAGAGERWPQQVSGGIIAFLEYVAGEPALAKTCLVEALAAGPASVQAYEESQQAFISLFRLGRDVSLYGGDLPETLEEAVVGGVFWIVYQRLSNSGPETVLELAPELIEFVLTPYVGSEEAKEAAAAAVAHELAPSPKD